MTFRQIHPPETIRAARAFWGAALSTAEIGRNLGVTKNVIVGLAKRNDFPPRPSPLKQMTDEETARNARIVEAWNTTEYTTPELATSFGLKLNYVNHVLRAARIAGQDVWRCDHEARVVRCRRAWQSQRAAE